MIHLLLFIPVALFALLEATWLSDFQVFGARPDFVLIVLTWVASQTGTQRGQVTGFITGLIEDALSISPPGFHALVRLGHGGITGLTRGAMSGDALLTPLLLTLLALVVRWSLALLLAGLFSLDAVLARLVSSHALIHGAITLVIAPVFFLVLERIYGDISRKVR